MRNSNLDFQRAAAALGLGVGGTTVKPYRPNVGGTDVRPYRVGAPAEMTQEDLEAAVLYSAQQFRDGGNSYFGFGQTIILANTAPTLIFKPFRPFTPLELRCPSTVIDLLIEQVTIQGKQFFSNNPGGGCPIECFSEVSRVKGFEFATIQPETGIQITVVNPTAGPLVFSGMFRGSQVSI